MLQGMTIAARGQKCISAALITMHAEKVGR
jgi:hypothetical protein